MGLLDKAAEKKTEPKVVEVEKPKRQRRSRKKEVEVEPAAVVETLSQNVNVGQEKNVHRVNQK